MKVLHAKQPVFSPPSEPFVLSRVLNPACSRPIPVLTQCPSDDLLSSEELQIYPSDCQPVILRKADALFRRTVNWSPYYLWAISRLRPDIVHAHFSFSATPVLFPVRLLEVPLVVSFYGVETKKFIHGKDTLKQLQSIIKQAAVITCLSEHMIDELADAGLSSKKIRLVRLGVDTELFNGLPRSWEPGQVLEVLSIARLHPEKGLIHLLRALARLDHLGCSNWRLRIVGKGDEGNSLKQAAIDLEIANRIEFAGTMPPAQVVEELRRAHVMVLPSLQETQGVVLQEAQATCTPVITTTVGGIPEGVLDGETGLLCPASSPEALAARILELTRNPSRFVKMGLAARQFVKNHFSRKVEYQLLQEIYREVLS